ncbi:unnamed protein product [Ilex paraguariensis]|uniref:Uncharacterized protein n=1 Tax=Ilex paraguariensis TaxID=185542 RepID=A0ABC8TW50_9AQUA
MDGCQGGSVKEWPRAIMVVKEEVVATDKEKLEPCIVLNASNGVLGQPLEFIC